MENPTALSYEAATKLPFDEVVKAAISVGCAISHETDKELETFMKQQIYRGYLVELEHGTKWGKDSPANLTNNDTKMTVRIAWAHILEDPVYYSRLDEMEKQSEGYLDILKTGRLCDYNKLVKKANEHLEPHRAKETKIPSDILDTTITNQKLVLSINLEQF
jgi:hypothetical protein